MEQPQIHSEPVQDTRSAVEIARKYLIDCGGDRHVATRNLIRAAQRDSELASRILNESLDARCEQLMRYVSAQFRHKVMKGWGIRESGLSAEAVAFYAPIPGPSGIPFGKATRTDLIEAASYCERLAYGNQLTARVCRELARQLRGEQKLEEKFSADEFLNIRREIEGSMR